MFFRTGMVSWSFKSTRYSLCGNCVEKRDQKIWVTNKLQHFEKWSCCATCKATVDYKYASGDVQEDANPQSEMKAEVNALKKKGGWPRSRCSCVQSKEDK